MDIWRSAGTQFHGWYAGYFPGGALRRRGYSDFGRGNGV